MCFWCSGRAHCLWAFYKQTHVGPVCRHGQHAMFSICGPLPPLSTPIIYESQDGIKAPPASTKHPRSVSLGSDIIQKGLGDLSVLEVAVRGCRFGVLSSLQMHVLVCLPPSRGPSDCGLPVGPQMNPAHYTSLHCRTHHVSTNMAT